ncbi:MAG: TrbI/VirB10 family protein [Akkermansiaceae bacterium]|nr:TrbI/VirB10 family protein [Akkermansiaceae bacterium]
MNPRQAVQFFKTRTGAFLIFAVLCVVGYILVRGFQPVGFGTTAKSSEPVPTAPQPQTVQSVTRDMTPFRPAKERPPAAEPPAPKEAPPAPKPLPPLTLFAQAPASPSTDSPLSADYAPFGRLISCQLVITVDSSSLDTPVVGLVTEDIWHDGRLIIPAGTEVHGSAQSDRMRERIASQGNWTLVWQDGRELRVSGIALDREKESDGTGWAITDGSAGLRGQLLKSDDYAEVKLFAATFLSGAAGAFTQREATLLGSQPMASAQNAALTGTQQVLNTYAKQIMDTIEREGFFVRVPAGKQFYLYVTETVDVAKASLGGSAIPTPAPNPSSP